MKAVDDDQCIDVYFEDGRSHDGTIAELWIAALDFSHCLPVDDAHPHESAFLPRHKRQRACCTASPRPQMERDASRSPGQVLNRTAGEFRVFLQHHLNHQGAAVVRVDAITRVDYRRASGMSAAAATG